MTKSKRIRELVRAVDNFQYEVLLHHLIETTDGLRRFKSGPHRLNCSATKMRMSGMRFDIGVRGEWRTISKSQFKRLISGYEPLDTGDK